MPNTDPYSASFTIPEGLHVDALSFDGELLTIHASTDSLAARCPLCGQPSRRIHGCYTRTLADLPRSGKSVYLRVRVHKFFCDQPSCERRIFAERLPEVARPFARGTDRQREALEWIAFALGGEAGARLARELGLIVSPDTLLNCIRGAFRADGVENVRVLGVDDFGLSRDGTPGTIMVDLERHKIVDLLGEHSAESLERWLRKHPKVEVASRDRSHICREGVSGGAPQATQIADRWHLIRNLAETLDEFLLQKRTVLKKAAARQQMEPAEAEDSEVPASEEGKHTYDDLVAPGPLSPNRPRPGYADRQRTERERYRLIVERWKEVHRLQDAGADVADIARKLNISRTTVYRYKNRIELPEFGQHRRKGGLLDPWVPYILRRWEEGCRNGRKLFREIREQGYPYSESNVTRLVAELRRSDGLVGISKKRRTTTSKSTRTPGTRHVASLFLRRKERLTEEQTGYLDRLRTSEETIARVYDLAQRFMEMIRDLDGERVEEWLTEAESCQAPALGRFATSLSKDLPAVRNGLTESWNNGPVEGFINKVKLLKRQGYGRANVDLLKARVMAA